MVFYLIILQIHRVEKKQKKKKIKQKSVSKVKLYIYYHQVYVSHTHQANKMISPWIEYQFRNSGGRNNSLLHKLYRTHELVLNKTCWEIISCTKRQQLQLVENSDFISPQKF